MTEPPKRRPGIHDVAREAGVSITTVSHSLNGRGRVLPETRDRVVAIAESLGYSANVHAQRLATGIHKTIALQVSGYGPNIVGVDSAYYIDLLNSASATALELGYMPILTPPDVTNKSIQLAADGALILDPTGDEPLMETVNEAGGIVVTAGRPMLNRSSVAGWVDNDLPTLTIEVLDHLESMGYEQPALITGSRERSYAADTIRAYERWVGERGKATNVVEVRDNPTADVAISTARQLLEREPRPDSIYASFDVFALGALRVANSMGLDVPNDLGIVATVDSQGLRSATPTLTAIENHPSELGAKAIRMLIGLLNGTIEPPVTEIVPAELQVRESTARSESPVG
ncbi:MAG: LacI family DNA-binding transcriptional regulator [Thermoleophilia bacterium]|nr:LacI family DNA-binding transcriptional regulator [Thermoleophilia bacterium]